MPLYSMERLQREGSKEKKNETSAAIQALKAQRLQKAAKQQQMSAQVAGPSVEDSDANLEDSCSDADDEVTVIKSPEVVKAKRRLHKVGAPYSDSTASVEDSLLQQMGAMHILHDDDTASPAAKVPGPKSDDYTPAGGRAVSVSSDDDTDDAAPSPELSSRPSAKASKTSDLQLDTDFTIPHKIARDLYPYQVDGVKWLYSLLKQGKGGILGDDMGLGKTRQSAAFIAGMFHSRRGKRVLIVAPVTLLAAWQKELKACNVGHLLVEYHGSATQAREASLKEVQRGRGIVLTTYGMVQHNVEALAAGSRHRSYEDDDEFKWDAVFLDEGHKCKNPKTKQYQALQTLPVSLWVVVTGTPIQNNLEELHALFDLCHPGLLGDRRDFKQSYEKQILAGLDRGATARARQLSAAKGEELRRMIKPFLLRREKKDVLADQGASAPSTSAVGGGGAAVQPKHLPRKNDMVVWLRMKPLQERIYYAFLNSAEVKAALVGNTSALGALAALKKVCDHPALLSKRAEKMVINVAHKWTRGAMDSDSDVESVLDSDYSSDDDSLDDFIDDGDDDDAYDSSEASPRGRKKKAAAKGKKAAKGNGGGQQEEVVELGLDDVWGQGSMEDLEALLLQDIQQRGVEASCKSAFVLQLLQELKEGGHRTLIFSQSLVMLNIIQAACMAKGMKVARIDGSLNAKERQAEVARFQRDDSISVFLLTTQVGGLGLTITAANRVIIVDPSWNPAQDNQSVDRAYRIGQKREVVVYRLITCGTIEEKIYRRQVFKGGLFRSGTEEGAQQQYFTRGELAELFLVTAEGLKESATQKQLHEQHAHQRQSTPELDAHLEALQKLPGCTGVSDHDLLFSNKPPEEPPMSPGTLAAMEEQEARSRPRFGAGPSAASAADDLSSLMASALQLGQPGGANSQAKSMGALVMVAEDRVQELRSLLTRVEGTLELVLPDGGLKARKHKAELEVQLAEATAHLADLQAKRTSHLLSQPPQPPPSTMPPPTTYPFTTQPASTHPKPYSAGQPSRPVVTPGGAFSLQPLGAAAGARRLPTGSASSAPAPRAAGTPLQDISNHPPVAAAASASAPSGKKTPPSSASNRPRASSITPSSAKNAPSPSSRTPLSSAKKTPPPSSSRPSPLSSKLPSMARLSSTPLPDDSDDSDATPASTKPASSSRRRNTPSASGTKALHADSIDLTSD